MENAKLIKPEVNSRCIWYDLQLERREDNITLAPIIDVSATLLILSSMAG